MFKKLHTSQRDLWKNYDHKEYQWDFAKVTENKKSYLLENKIVIFF